MITDGIIIIRLQGKGNMCVCVVCTDHKINTKVSSVTIFLQFSNQISSLCVESSFLFVKPPVFDFLNFDLEFLIRAQSSEPLCMAPPEVKFLSNPRRMHSREEGEEKEEQGVPRAPSCCSTTFPAPSPPPPFHTRRAPTGLPGTRYQDTGPPPPPL